MTVIYVNEFPLEKMLMVVPAFSVLLCCSFLGCMAVCYFYVRNRRGQKMGPLLNPLEPEYMDEAAGVKNMRANSEAPKVRWNAMDPEYMDEGASVGDVRSSHELPMRLTDINWSSSAGPARPAPSYAGACIFAESMLDDEPEIPLNCYQSVAAADGGGEVVFTV